MNEYESRDPDRRRCFLILLTLFYIFFWLQKEISTQNGTTTANVDYTTITALTVNFDPGVDVQTVPVTILQDDFVDKNEVFFVMLSNPSTREALGNLHKGTVTIFDDDGKPIHDFYLIQD